MIHQVRASSDDIQRLCELIDLQFRLLNLASKFENVNCESMEYHLSEGYGESASKVAGWVDRHSTLIDNLNVFAAHPAVDEKSELVDQMYADICLLFEPAPQKLQATFQDASGWKKAAGDFCRHFYKIWGQEGEGQRAGFPAYLFIEAPVSRGSYSRWDFIENFLAANDALYLCAICDTTAFRTSSNNRAYTSIEHFFPKSIYPHVSIHPYNLIPICSSCNSLKHADDIMTLCGTLGIQELLLPYQQGQPGLSQMAYIEVLPSPTRQSHPLEIKFKPASKFPDSESLIDHFNELYKVEERWNVEMDQLDEQVFRRIQQFLLADVQMGNSLSDVEFVIQRLEILMALTSMENLGKDPFGMATIWMLKYHIDTLKREGKEALIHKNLVEWAATDYKTMEILHRHVEELYGRVPESSK